jgi:hypothetical protein
MKAKEQILDHEYLLSILDYDPMTGIFTWKARPGYIKKAGRKAGWSNGRYMSLRILDNNYPSHRVAWFYVHKEWPPELIDHIDRNGKNNRIANLRLASFSQNAINKPSSRKNALGVKGVTYAPHVKKFKSVAVLKGKLHFLGYYHDIESASAAYKAFAKEHHGEFHLNN